MQSNRTNTLCVHARGANYAVIDRIFLHTPIAESGQPERGTSTVG